jgi:hypothetical protein
MDHRQVPGALIATARRRAPRLAMITATHHAIHLVTAPCARW